MSKDSGEALEDLRYRREQARLGGGLKRQESIRISGRGTARDRIRNLLDDFQNDLETGAFRDSDYVAGPAFPRSFYTGFKYEF